MTTDIIKQTEAQLAELARMQMLTTSPKITEASTEEIWGAVRYMAKAIGVPSASLPDQETAIIIVGFLKDNFKDLRVAEIKDAADMACAGKLKGVDMGLYGFVFSNATIGKILSAYRFNEQRLKALQEYNRTLIAPKAEISEDEKQKIIKQNIISLYNDHLQGRPVVDYGSSAYNYLTQNNHFAPSAQRKWELVEKYLPIIEHDLKSRRAVERDEIKRIDIDRQLTAQELNVEAVRRAKLELLKEYFISCNEFDRDIFEK